MALVPFLEREQISNGQHYDTAEKVVGSVLNFHKVVAHSPRALEGYVMLSVALKDMKLDRKLRELAYLRTAQLNHCDYWIALHMALGQRVGLTNAQLEGLANHADTPAEFNELEALVIRYAEQLTVTASTDEALDADLRKHLSDQELVELAVTVATANATTRICNALKIEADWGSIRFWATLRRAKCHCADSSQSRDRLPTLSWVQLPFARRRSLDGGRSERSTSPARSDRERFHTASTRRGWRLSGGHSMQKRMGRSRRGISIGLQIDGEAWHRVASLEKSGPDDRHFVLTTDENGTTTVRFGDGEHGAKLPTGTDRVVAAYRSSKRFVAVVQQQGRVIVDKDWSESGLTGGRFYGMYRGVVTNNVDPMSQWRVQAQVTAILGNQALWAVPCRPVGAAAVPAVGASVWVAFEGGDPSLPVWMGITQ